MKFTISIDCNSSAFGVTEEACQEEVKRVLNNISIQDLWIAWEHAAPLSDSNYNKIGEARFTYANEVMK